MQVGVRHSICVVNLGASFWSSDNTIVYIFLLFWHPRRRSVLVRFGVLFKFWSSMNHGSRLVWEFFYLFLASFRSCWRVGVIDQIISTFVFLCGECSNALLISWLYYSMFWSWKVIFAGYRLLLYRKKLGWKNSVTFVSCVQIHSDLYMSFHQVLSCERRLTDTLMW